MKYERIHRGFLESDIDSIRKFVLNLQIELHEKMQKQDIYCNFCSLLAESDDPCSTCKNHESMKEMIDYYEELESFYIEYNLESLREDDEV